MSNTPACIPAGLRHDRRTQGARFAAVTCGLLLLVAALGAPPVSGDGLRWVPLEDPVYAFLEYARSDGALDYLPRVRPFTTGTVVSLLSEASRGDGWTADRAEEHLERLSSARRRLLASEFGDDGVIAVEAETRFSSDAALGRLGDTIPTFTIPFTLSIGLADSVHVSLDGVPAFAYWGWEREPYGRYDDPLKWDYYVYTQPLDGGDGGFNHSGYHDPGSRELQIMFDTRNQFSVDLDYLILSAGRAAPDWGPGRRANLILSGTAKPFDHLGFEMPLGGAGRFSWITGILHDVAYEPGALDERLMTAHRVEYRITDWLLFAIYESVIYDFSFKLAYLNPLSFYYVSEVTQGSPDNKLGGADLIVNLPGIELYGSFFADDWDAGHMFELNSSHNEWAGILGVHSAGLLPGLSLNLELTYLSHWMYTHYTWRSATEVGKSYQHYGSHLGHFLDPNAWMLFVGARYDYAPESRAATSFRLIRNGRGDIDSPPDWAAESDLHGVDSYRDIRYSFLDRGKPGFTIETIATWSVSAHHRFPDPSLTLEAEYALEYSFENATEDGSRIPDSEQLEHFLTVVVSWSPGVLF